MTKLPQMRFAIFMIAIVCWGTLFGQGTLQLLPGTEKVYAIQNGIHRLVGTVSFTYQGNTMYCDSAHYNEGGKEVRAYGNVHIQKSGINLYADSIYYAEKQKYAKLWGHVKARDNAYKMSADSMDYDAKRGRAIFRSSGKIESILSDESIVCQRGYFYPGNGSFFFSGKVHYKKGKLDVKADTLQFAYEQQKLYFLGNAQLRNDTVQIYCQKGWFHVQDEYGKLYNQAEVFHQQHLIKGDTLIFNTKKNDYEAFGKVFYKDTKENFALMGQHALLSDTDHKGYMTGSVLGFKRLEQDTLYWTADTLYLSKDSLNNNKYIIANQDFKFINKNLQGRSDYAQFELKTQELLLEEQPILWTNTAELKAQQAHIFLKDSSLQKIQLTDKASILLELETDSLYNQLAARELNAYFDSTGQLNFVEALGQAWTIFYPETQKQLNDSTLQIQREGLNRLYSEYLEINIAGKEIVGITYFEQPEGIFFPMNQIDQKERWIKNFSWNPNLRPLKVSDLR
jgi:lipopolysaccharide assembly outer membrane protein LptD (OstA)